MSNLFLCDDGSLFLELSYVLFIALFAPICLPGKYLRGVNDSWCIVLGVLILIISMGTTCFMVRIISGIDF